MSRQSWTRPVLWDLSKAPHVKKSSYFLLHLVVVTILLPSGGEQGSKPNTPPPTWYCHLLESCFTSKTCWFVILKAHQAIESSPEGRVRLSWLKKRKKERKKEKKEERKASTRIESDMSWLFSQQTKNFADKIRDERLKPCIYVIHTIYGWFRIEEVKPDSSSRVGGSLLPQHLSQLRSQSTPSHGPTDPVNVFKLL